MKKMKRRTFKDRIRNAWRAFSGKPIDSITIGMSLKRCDECDCGQAPPSRYFHEITYLDKLVLVVFYEFKNGKKTELARGHGHIIHKGALGVAQAASYAMRQIYTQFGG